MARGGTGRALVSNQHHLRFHNKTALICITGSSQGTASELKGKQRQRCRCTWMRHLLTSLAHSALLQPTDERAHSSSSSSSRDALSAAHGDLIVPAVCRRSSTSTETILDQPKKKKKKSNVKEAQQQTQPLLLGRQTSPCETSRCCTHTLTLHRSSGEQGQVCNTRFDGL